MGLFDKLFKKEAPILPVDVADDVIVAVADGELFDVATVGDPMFAEQMMGQTIAFKFPGDKVTVCAPANGELSVVFPTGHAFGITMANGVELLVHIGVDTVSAKGDGFKSLGKAQGTTVKAGEPIVEVDLKKLGAKFEMSTMLIVTNTNDVAVDLTKTGPVTRGQKIN